MAGLERVFERAHRRADELLPGGDGDLRRHPAAAIFIVRSGGQEDGVDRCGPGGVDVGRGRRGREKRRSATAASRAERRPRTALIELELAGRRVVDDHPVRGD